MSEPDSTGAAAPAADAAAEERAAILEIVERHLRNLAHGHGANGVQILQQLIEEIRRRDRA